MLHGKDKLIPQEISLQTLQLAQKLVHYFAEQREIFLTISNTNTCPNEVKIKQS
jgi:hypothetical protein